MSWKDDYREEYESSGLSWDEFHERRFVHVSELDSATATVEDLAEQVSALRTEYQQFKREFHEVRVLLESEEFDP